MFEFIYGNKQMPGQVGGWKNDPRPVVLVFMDDGQYYIEGINTNYLSDHYMKKIRQIMSRFPGVNQDNLLNITKRVAPYAIKKGYRKYIRSSLRDVYIYVYKDDFEREVDYIAKTNIEGTPSTSVAKVIRKKIN
jgi:hypothetical protein